MNTQHVIISLGQALLAAGLVLVLLATSFFILEPKVGLGQTTADFTIRTVITDETSFLVVPANVQATTSINGITGGTANGSTTVVVRTNDPQGYNMSIRFFNNGTANAMQGSVVGGNNRIMDYPTSGEPTFNFSTASTSAVFGYTVSVPSFRELDLDPSFRDDGASCNTGSSDATDRCWMEPTISNFQIINTNAPAPASTSTIHFRIHVPNNPSPMVPADTYTATATLTITSN